MTIGAARGRVQVELISVQRDALAFASALTLYGLFYVAVFLNSLLSGNYIAPSDSLDFGLAAFLSRPMLWTDGMYSGYPIAADPQALTWYPLLILFRATGLGWNLFIIAAYIIASAGCFLLVRRMTGSNSAGVFGGFAYGYSGVLLGHIGHFNQVHAAAWVPLVFYGLQLVREGHARTGAATASIAFALMWLAGHPQVAVYTIYVAGAIVLGGVLIDRPTRAAITSRLRWSAIALVLGFGLAAITILPMIELGQFSHRAASSWDLYTSKSLPAWQLLALVFPSAFGGFWTPAGFPVPYFGAGSPVEMTGYLGLLPFTLGIAGAFMRHRLRKDGTLWLAIATIAALLCLGAATPIGTLFFYAPGYSSFRVPARHLFVVTFCLAVGSGLAFAELTSRRESRRTCAGMMLTVLLVAALAFTVYASQTSGIRELVQHSRPYETWAIAWPLALAAVIVSCAAVGGAVKITNGRASILFAAVLIALHVADMTIFHYRFPGTHFEYADVPPEQVQLHPRMRALREELSRTGERVIAVDGSKNQFLLPNLTRPWDVPAASGTGSLGIESYVDMLGMGGPGDVSADTLSEPHQAVDLFAIRYALVPQHSRLAADLARQRGRWSAVEDLHYYEHDPDTYYTLFRNGRTRPRAWCVSDVARTTPGGALFAIRSGHLPDGRRFDPADLALVEDETLLGWRVSGTANQRSVIASHTTSGRRRYLVDGVGSCLLVVSEVYYPWWRASVDALSVSPVRVNHAMFGIVVPPGSHIVQLWLRPISVWTGGAVSALSVMIWLALMVPLKKSIGGDNR